LSWEDRIPHTVILSNTNSICMEAAVAKARSLDPVINALWYGKCYPVAQIQPRRLLPCFWLFSHFVFSALFKHLDHRINPLLADKIRDFRLLRRQ